LVLLQYFIDNKNESKNNKYYANLRWNRTRQITVITTYKEIRSTVNISVNLLVNRKILDEEDK
jgi:hypothetical protein